MEHIADAMQGVTDVRVECEECCTTFALGLVWPMRVWYKDGQMWAYCPHCGQVTRIMADRAR